MRIPIIGILICLIYMLDPDSPIQDDPDPVLILRVNIFFHLHVVIKKCSLCLPSLCYFTVH